MADQQRSNSRNQDKAALQSSNRETLRKMFKQMEKELAAALPKFITVERMIRVASTTVQRVPKLLECHPVTVVGAVMQSAQLGLEPDNITGQAYLVPFWNSKNRRLECTLIPGYRGLMNLARRSKQISTFDARVVKQGDLFDYEYGSRQFLKHKPALGMVQKDGKYILEQKDEPETVAAYAIAFFNGRVADGSAPFQFHVMPRPDLEKAMQFTSSRDFNDKSKIVGPWIEHPDAMRTKTVVRRTSKLLPFSIELDTAVALEERAIAGRSQNLGVLGAEALGVDFDAADDEAPEGTEGEGEGGEASIDPELVKRLDAGFAKLGFNEAKRTTKMQEFKGRLPELLQWLDAEAAKNARPAGQGSTDATSTKREAGPVERTTNDGSIGTGPDRSGSANGGDTPRRTPGKFRI